MAHQRSPLQERFWLKVDKTPGHGPKGECWLWTASVEKGGYGKIGLGPRGKFGKAHRLSYEFANGPIPVGLLIRHECDTPRCVNPAHLIVGTQAQNIADMMERGRHYMANVTHCQRGHEFTPENTYLPSRGGRMCRECALSNERARYRKRHAPVAPTTTGRTCNVCACKEPETRFGKTNHICFKCQYIKTKAKRGVWNKQKQKEIKT